MAVPIVLQAGPQTVQQERTLDRICWADDCTRLTVGAGHVFWLRPAPFGQSERIEIGSYERRGEDAVPAREAAIRDLRSAAGWRVVVSVFLHRDKENAGDAGLRVRFFDPHGSLRTEDTVMAFLQDVELGRPFGGTDEIFMISSWQEHVYNVETDVWYLPAEGKPRRILFDVGSFASFVNGPSTVPKGIVILHQTYDGVDADTKGWLQQFYAWDPATRTLTRQLR